MNLLNQWVGSILCFLIFMTMITILLPSKKYERYLRFFAGMVLILLVIQPLTGSFRLEDRIAYYFEAISFQKESQDLNRQILGIEEERLKRVIAEYEHAVEQDVAAMAEDLGFLAEEVDVTIEGDQDMEDYGKVTHVFLRVVWEEEGWETKDGSETRGEPGGRGEAGSRGESGAGGEKERATEETIVEPVEIAGIAVADIGAAADQAGENRGTDEWAAENRAAAGQAAENQPAAGQNVKNQPAPDQAAANPTSDSQEDSLEAGSRNTQANEELRKLRRKVERYYGLESKEVELELKVR